MKILKLGGSLITDKNSSHPIYNGEVVEKLAEDISEYLKSGELILVHGAGSFGHPIVKKSGIHKGIETGEQKLAFCETQKQMNQLNALVCETLQKKGVRAFPFQVSASSIMDNGRLVEMNVKVIDRLLSMHIVPVLYGVPSYDETQKCSILSGDQIITYLCKSLPVAGIVHATEVDGIFTQDPFSNSDAQLVPRISSVQDLLQIQVGESRSQDVTEGMRGKLRELLMVDVEAQIVNGAVSNNVLRALQGEHIGTIIKKKD